MSGFTSQSEVELAALTLFAAAMDEAPAARAAWLERECAGEQALLARVQALIAADAAHASAFLDGPAASLAELDAPPLLPPDQVGPYRLEELIGAGGMGSVYRAQRNDGLFEQAVAVKFIRPIPGLARVEPLIDAERRLLARMQHPAIARILDGGTTGNGLHFLVMEFVSGVALDAFAVARGLDLRSRIGLLREVCGAVAHAHQNLVLHCDLKPANILVTGEGRPKLIDFGVARIQDVVDASRPEGYTRGYTSPQRLAGAPATVADDVYSLGVVLCELVLGELPDVEPSQLAARLPGDLAAIAGKALALEREARYAGVAAFEDDLRCWLERRPVLARGRDWRYRARKLVERHPWRVAATTLAGVGLLVALVVIATLYARAEAARLDAEQRFAEVRALANYMLFELDGRLEQTPGNTAARREMVGRSQQYLDALATTAGGDLELQREVAVGLARLAEVQGVSGRAHVGDPQGARVNLERAETMLVALAAARPARADWQRDLGRVRYLLALVYGATDNDVERQLRKAREAEANLDRAVAGIAAWQPAIADVVDLEVLLTSARLTQADALRQREDHAAAAALQAGEEARLLALPAQIREAMEFDYQSGRPAMLLGDSLYYLGRPAAALAAYRRAVERFERGLERTPLHRRLLDGTLIGYWSIAGTLDGMNRLDEALAAARRAVQLGERLMEIDPENAEAQRLRALGRGQLALVLARLGRHGEAIRLTEQGVAGKEARRREAPDDAERVRDVAVPLRNLAKMYLDSGRRADGCRMLQRAIDEWTAIDRRWPLAAADRRNELEAVRAAAVSAGC